MALSSRLAAGLRGFASTRGIQQSLRFASTVEIPKYEYVEASLVGEKKNVGLIRLNRPKALNALCDALVSDLAKAVKLMDKTPGIGAIVITGSEKAFAAGADIKEMKDTTFASNVTHGLLQEWLEISKCTKPVIAAVNGYALGGGCELAMMCDIIYAGDKARFGQPEVSIGTIPGAGGTQRIARSCGKSKAMEICLSGTPFSAEEAEKMGLVSKIFPADKLVDEAVKLGEKISSHSPLIIALCKESVNKAFETSLAEGLNYERRIFHATFSTKDQQEGMNAFVEKRAPKWTSS
uniref:Probable enoyl-CoA hydratase, mitochondrial n=1 Tax=Frankliniella cephalica TaxID=407008 RepID=A0A481SXN9_9NEOP|nr:putative cyclohex-1-ene-1-carboxyl-CoA hydratase [Frankliniella cephalica]